MDYDPIIPSSLLQIQDSNSSGSFNHSFNNFSLKSGAILKTYDIEDDRNLSKLTPEYDVVTISQDEDRGITSTIYKHCISLDSLGGISDFSETKLNTPTKNDFKSNLESDKQDGSLVLLLCLDGISEKGIIIGGLSHPSRKTTLTKANGKHKEGEFNGINWQINKDGELKITFKSASDNKGKYTNEQAKGSFAKFEKDGSIVISDNNTENIRIDKTKKTIDVNSNKDISFSTGNNFNITAINNIDLKLKGLLISASGKASINFKNSFDLIVGSEFKLSSKSTTIQSTAIKLQAATINIQSPMIKLGSAMTLTDGDVTADVPLSAPSLSAGDGASLTMIAPAPVKLTVKDGIITSIST